MGSFNLSKSDAKLGIIVIGRNEGESLRRSLASVPKDDRIIPLYVDSGSTDGSVELASSLGVEVHELDPVRPFSPARARGEGVDILLGLHPDLEFIQFVDGDCELYKNWITTAVKHFEKKTEVAIVCGHLSEKEPERSVYNWLSSLQWKRPAGDIESCGGIFMMRSGVYRSVGGFNRQLMTREEKDLCDRVHSLGYRIQRIPEAMAIHDSGLLSFRQWWQRAVWGGYGDALQISNRKGRLSREHLHRVRRYLTWPVVVPLLAVLGLLGSAWSTWMLLLTLSCLLSFGLLFARIMIRRLLVGDSLGTAITYAFFMILRKFASGYGFLLYFILRGQNSSERPDPHRA